MSTDSQLRGRRHDILDFANGNQLRRRSEMSDSSSAGATSADSSSSSSSNRIGVNLDKFTQFSYGKTPGGKVFRVPSTRDMVTALLDPKQQKSAFDWLTLGIMGIEIGLFFALPSSRFKQVLFIVLFFFWRLAYNVGLGLLLKYQSDCRGIVRLAEHYKVFDKEARPELYRWLEHQLSMKMGDDYDFAAAPLEYNTWLLFRQLVDVILMNDFTAYICFALAWFNVSPQSTFFMGNLTRWVGGLFLIVFNIWVKIDAQRVVKDFAWYWGDFFFLIEQSLTFDGVFEMAPHPMYSVGYVGYYGVSLMAASYTVLFASIAAHILQFIFLALVETPHIEKTYNPPKTPKRRPHSQGVTSPVSDEYAGMIHKALDQQASRNFYTHYFRRDLIGFKNFDLCRSTDLASAAVMFYSFITPLVLGGNTGVTFAISQAVFWRIFHSYGLGALLRAQSKEKFFTRHFVKWGGGVEQAFQNWKSIYNLSLSMTYISFMMACWKMHSLPSDWTYGTTLARHTLGYAFIALHIWTSVSIYEVLGDYGWFYGDFFLADSHPTLLYNGVYRYLNNPEKIVGNAVYWGMALITNSWTIFMLALFSHASNFLFLKFVEAPHMQKLYGSQIRKEAGFTKTIKSAATALPQVLPPKLQQDISKLLSETAELELVVTTTRNMGHALKEVLRKAEKVVVWTAGAVDDVVVAARQKLYEAIQGTKSLLETSCAWIIHPLAATQKEPHDLTRYAVTIVMDPIVTPTAKTTMTTNSHGTVVLGQPIHVKWTAPENHSPRDWVGVYPMTANKDPFITSAKSHGLWKWVVPECKEGVMVFKGSLLPWHTGTYEFRYHHNGTHTVMARSLPLKIVAPNFGDPQHQQDKETVERSLLRIIQNVLDNDPERVPVTSVDEYIGMNETEAEHVAYAIKLAFGVEFAPEIIMTDQCVARLTQRIFLAIDTLRPFDSSSDMSKSSTSSPHHHHHHHSQHTHTKTMSELSLIRAATVCSPSNPFFHKHD